MLSRIKQDETWLGDPIYINTTAVGSDDPVMIHQPAQDATSNVWYVVTAGTQVGIFTSW